MVYLLRQHGAKDVCQYFYQEADGLMCLKQRDRNDRPNTMPKLEG